MAKTLALIFGVIFVLIGILGFLPNPLVGQGAIFHTDTAHNIVHLIFGVILVGCALRMPAQASLWLKVIGAVYLILAVLGFVMVPNGGPLLGLVATNAADHLLHVVLGIVLIVAGFVGKSGSSAPSRPAAPAPQQPPSSGAM